MWKSPTPPTQFVWTVKLGAAVLFGVSVFSLLTLQFVVSLLLLAIMLMK